MPAAVAKGIIVSISIITALSLAVLENPQIQAWLEEQRQKIAELLRSIGEELDPQSRRTAEAFAYEGRTPATDLGLHREASGSKEAAAVATGRSISNTNAVRRIPVQGRMEPDEAEERRRKGREYLAKRNMKMHEMQQRRKSEKADGAVTPPTPTSFDAMVDGEGKLRLSEPEVELPTPPSSVPDKVKAEMREVERNLKQPLLVSSESAVASGSGWSFGSRFTNPFSDEYELDHSETPKPPVPPKIALENEHEPSRTVMPGSFTPRQPEQRDEELSYEEQLAIALSLSEAEAEAASRTSSETSRSADEDGEDAELRAAIAASLKDMNTRQATVTLAEATPRQANAVNDQPLVDLTPPSPTVRPQQPVRRGPWESVFDQDYSPTYEPLSLASNTPQPEEEDELYRVTPQLTRARLASLDAQKLASPAPNASSMPYDPVHEAAGQLREPEASFYSAASSAPSPASTQTMDHEATAPQLNDISEDAPPAGARTPTSRSSFGFRTDSESDSDTFASMSAPASRPQSPSRSEISNVEVVDVVEDSDMDMLSDEGDGVATPDSWTEVGSRDGDSEMTDDDEGEREVLRRELPVFS